MPTTPAAIDAALYDWATAVAGNGLKVQFENEDLADSRAPRIDLHVTTGSADPNPVRAITVPDPTVEVPNPQGVESVTLDSHIDVKVTVRDNVAAMATALKLIASLKSQRRYDQPSGGNTPGLWQIMGLGGVISPPSDLSALETGATLSRIEFTVRFHAAIQYTFGADYIKTTRVVVREGEKGTVFDTVMGTNPHVKPEGCN